MTETAPKKATCGNCRYWLDPGQAVTDKTPGKCRRYPPIPAVSRLATDDRQAGFISEFPLMYAFGWCGEWVWVKEPDMKAVQ